MKTIRALLITAASGAVIALGSAQTAGAANLVVNGDFESNGGPGQIGYNTAATGWNIDPAASSSYTFLFASGTADGPGANGQYGNLQLWGPGNGSANGLPASSPGAGYYIAQDPAFQTAAIQQTITGLTPGQKYNLSFYWGGAQQYGFTGPTFEGWQVSLGAQTFSTPTLNNASHGFTGWQSESFTYTATSASEVLSFFAVGGPPGVPPFAVLDGVSMVSAVPEPSTVLAGASAVLLLVGGGLRRMFRQRTQA